MTAWLVGQGELLHLPADACRDRVERTTRTGFRYRTMPLWGKPEQRESGSGVRGGTGTSCKTEEEGIQNTELQFEGVCHLPREERYPTKSHRL